MKRIHRTWTAILALGLATLAPAADSGFSREKWLADFEQLKASLTSGYPNLEWHAQRGMDLAALEKRAREQLAEAAGPDAARAALTQFLSRFGDGHLSLAWAPVVSTVPVETRPLCARLGFTSRPDTTAIARHLPGYAEFPELRAPVSAGTVEIAGRRLGVLRVPIFMPDSGMCEAAIAELALDATKACDDTCGERISRFADSMLVKSVESAVRALVATKPDVILVDVAANGGGNDSAIAVARMLTRQPLESPRMQFVRGAARAADLRQNADALRGALPKAHGHTRLLLTAVIARLDEAAIEAVRPCDLSPLWQGKAAVCSNLLNDVAHAGGLLGTELIGVLRNQAWSTRVSSTAQYEYTQALWTGPLLILVDGGSGSATELFAAMLQDAGRARVIGAPTVGAGCGWTLPRQEIVLTNSGGRLLMPDCTRLRRDGTNELDGIQPDVLIGLRRYDSAVQRMQRLQSALPAILTVR